MVLDLGTDEDLASFKLGIFLVFLSVNSFLLFSFHLIIFKTSTCLLSKISDSFFCFENMSNNNETLIHLN